MRVPIELTIDSSGLVDDETDRMTRNLLTRLREADIEARLNTVPSPVGSKSVDAVTVASLIVPAFASAVPVLVSVVRAWSSLHDRRVIIVLSRADGSLRAEYPVDALSTADLKALTEMIADSE